MQHTCTMNCSLNHQANCAFENGIKLESVITYCTKIDKINQYAITDAHRKYGYFYLQVCHISLRSCLQNNKIFSSYNNFQININKMRHRNSAKDLRKQLLLNLIYIVLFLLKVAADCFRSDLSTRSYHEKLSVLYFQQYNDQVLRNCTIGELVEICDSQRWFYSMKLTLTPNNWDRMQTTYGNLKRSHKF